MGERIGLVMGFTTVNRVRSLSEEYKTHNQMVNSRPRSKFLNKLVITDGVRGVSFWINWLFLLMFFLVLQ